MSPRAGRRWRWFSALRTTTQRCAWRRPGASSTTPSAANGAPSWWRRSCAASAAALRTLPRSALMHASRCSTRLARSTPLWRRCKPARAWAGEPARHRRQRREGLLRWHGGGVRAGARFQRSQPAPTARPGQRLPLAGLHHAAPAGGAGDAGARAGAVARLLSPPGVRPRVAGQRLDRATAAASRPLGMAAVSRRQPAARALHPRPRRLPARQGGTSALLRRLGAAAGPLRRWLRRTSGRLAASLRVDGEALLEPWPEDAEC